MGEPSLTILAVADCPNVEPLLRRLRDLGHTASVRVVVDDDEAEVLGFTGSPTLWIDGADPFAQPGAGTGLACRVYATPDGPAGLPSTSQLRVALLDR